MNEHSIPNKHLKSKEELARGAVDHYLSNPSSMPFDPLGDVLEGNILMEINNINAFGVIISDSETFWLVCTKSKEPIYSPSKYLGLSIIVDRSHRVDQIAPGEGPLTSSSQPDYIGSAGYTTVSGQVMVCMKHFTDLGDHVEDPAGIIIGTTTWIGPTELAEVTLSAITDIGKPVRSDVSVGDMIHRAPTFQTGALHGRIVLDLTPKWIVKAELGPVVSQGGDSNTPWDSPGGTHAIGVHNSYDNSDRTMSVYKLSRSRAVQQIPSDQVAGKKRKSASDLSPAKPSKHFLRSGSSY